MQRFCYRCQEFAECQKKPQPINCDRCKGVLGEDSDPLADAIREKEDRKIEIPGWDEHFLEIAKVCSKRSKDESTKVGAVIVGVDKEIVSTGYNSFPRKINDNVPERQERPEKYFWFEHAERNAIYNSARHGVSLKGCTLYVQAMPCTDCARGIVQVGIKRVVMDAKENEEWLKRPKWKEHMERSLQLFSEAGVEVVFWEKING